MDGVYTDSDEGDFTDTSSESIHEDANSDFNTRYNNRQILMLRNLRKALGENKILRRRVEILENELENYQDFTAPNLPLPLKDQSTSPEPILEQNEEYEVKQVEPEVKPDVLVVTKSTADKSCQIEIEIPTSKDFAENVNFFIATKPSPPPPQTPQEPIVEKKEPVLKPIEKQKSVLFEKPKQVNKISQGCQSEEDTKDKNKIIELTNLIQILKTEHENKLENLNSKIKELNSKCEELSKKLEDSNKNLEISNEKLSDYLKSVIMLTQEKEELTSYKQKHDIILVENEHLYKELQTKQEHLDESNKKFFEISESLNQSLELIEKQKGLIKNLETENEKHLKDKHVVCQQKISELVAESNRYQEKANELEVDNQAMNETIVDLNKQLDRYKSDLKNFNFKEFVSIKRELNTLKQERERQFANAVTMPNASVQVQSPLPPIKPSKKNLFNFFN